MYPDDRSSDVLRSTLLGVLGPAAGHGPAALDGYPPDTVPAAVLAPILASGREPRMVFTERTDTMSRHAGEISFPGGLVDEGEPPEAAALREAREELGLRVQDVELLGTLPPVHTHVSGILILPFVGWVTVDPRFTPNAAEIARVLEFPLRELIARGTEEEFEHEGQRFRTFVYDMDGYVIWGATGRILRSLIELLEPRSRTS
jgi:8-oxo-dGTP pyrophosphatase MutT (NUDIX family)